MERKNIIEKLTSVLSNLDCCVEYSFGDRTDSENDDKNLSVGNYYIKEERIYVSNVGGRHCVVGSVYDLDNISFYYCPEDNDKLDILFEYPIYNLVVTHKYFMAVEVSVYQKGAVVFEKKKQHQWNMIERWIETVMMENHFVTEREQIKLIDKLYHLAMLESKQVNEDEWINILDEVRRNTKYLSIQRQFCITCLLLDRLEDLNGIIAVENYTIIDLYKIITGMYEKYNELLDEEICEKYGAKMLDFFLKIREGK